MKTLKAAGRNRDAAMHARALGSEASTRTSSPGRRVLARKCACGGDKEPCPGCSNDRKRNLSRWPAGSAAGIAPPIVNAVLKSPGVALDPRTRSEMERRFQHDFSRVRVLTDTRATESARAIRAVAYTVGTRIVFDRGRYTPHTAEGDTLLAHELAHVVQQSNTRADPDAPIEVLSGDTHSETEAVRMVQVGTLPSSRAAVPALAPFRGRPVRPPRTRLGGQTGTDTSLEGMAERARARSYSERQRWQAERPVATLQRGGRAPDFITEHGTRRHSWIGGPGGGGAVDVRVRKFHVLDAIEYAVSRANTEADLERILDEYIGLVGVMFRAIEVSARRRRSIEPEPSPLLAPLAQPLIPAELDPGAERRLEVFEAAARRRAEQVPALARSSLIPRSSRRGRCRLVPAAPSGGDPLSNLYCHVATGTPYSYRIYIEGASGAATRRWAEIDALRGNTWYECKCGYEGLLSGVARGDAVAEAVMAKMDQQVLNHADIARTCGLEYRYIVSNDYVADRLRSRWFGNVEIVVVPWEPCD